MISFTEKATLKVKEISESEGIGHFNVRVKVIGGGCHGMQHDLYFEELPPLDMDEVIPFDGITIIIDQVSSQYLENAVVDYQETDLGGGFSFKSPDITGTCGCGSSVSY